MKSRLNIAIVGYGVIGSTLGNWLEKNTAHRILKSDMAKGYNDDISKADVVFVCIHIATEVDGTQDLTNLEGIIEKCPNVPIFVRTTVLPGTCDNLGEKFNKNVYFFPEFLREKYSKQDFDSQKLIFTAETELLRQIFPDREYITMSNKEAELTKYAHNVFGALKVTYFNMIYKICVQHDCEYSAIKQGVMSSGFINNYWTKVPGEDGKFGYGGKCFPKDIKAFEKFIFLDNLTMEAAILNGIQELNTKYR